MKYNQPIFVADFNWITMKKIYFVALFAMGLLLGGCSQSGDNSEAVEVAKSQLSIGLPIEMSRTTVDAEGRASWIEGDTFALWAENKEGVRKMDGAKFSMMYFWHSFQSAVFTAETELMEEGDYTYYAVAPQPKSYADNKATYTIPATQQGDLFNGAYDIMVATPVEGKALLSDEINKLELDFQHKMHILKVNIAKNDLGVDVGKLVFTFPGNVTGDVSVNITNAASAATLANGSKELVINCANGAGVGEDVWGVIFPQMIIGSVKVVAYGVDGRESVEKSISFMKTFAAGHITPLSFSVPKVRPTLRFSIGTNNLGESIEKITITANDGKKFEFTANEQNRYDYIANSASELTAYSGKTFTATFESKSAIVSSTFTMPSNLGDDVNVVPALTVPYLLFEDFSCIHTAGESYGDNTASDGDERDQPGVSLDSYMDHKGWNAARFMLGVGTCPRLNVRYQIVKVYMSFSSCHHGRLDTPTLSNLKDGASVKLRVQFDAGGFLYQADADFDGMEIMSIGLASHTTQGTINGIPTGTKSFSLNPIGPIEYSSTLNDYGTTYAVFKMLSKYTTNDFGSTFPTYSAEMYEMTNSSRICFYPFTSMDKDALQYNNECAIYVDNIKVSIAK